MILRTPISMLIQIAGSEQSPQWQPEYMVYQPSPNWLDLAVAAIFLAVLISALFLLIRRLKSAASQTSMAIDSNNEAVRVTREATRVYAESIEVSRETNRLLAALIDELRRKSDSDQEKK